MALYKTIELGFSEDKYKKEMEKANAKFVLNDDHDDYEILAIERLENKVLVCRYRHKCCGNEFHLRQSKFNNEKTRCPECSNNRPITYEDVKKLVEDETDNEYQLLSTGLSGGVRSSIHIKHNIPECGKEYDVAIRKFKDGNRCNCNRRKSYDKTISMTDEKYNVRIKEITDGEYIKIGTYTNHNIPFKVRHVKCGHEWDICGYDFVYNGHRCPKCSLKKSNKEVELLNFIQENYNGEIRTNDRPKFLNGQELDMYIPDLNIAIEFNGLYWHSEEGSNGKCNKYYHINKLNLCNQNGIRLIYVDEEEWDTKKDIVKSKILHIFKLNDKPKIYARKCIIKEISAKERRKFLDMNHIQGGDSANISLGMFYNDKLISVMSFVKPRKPLNGNSDLYSYELSRFASDINYIVIGAFGKFMKFFKDNYECGKIITFANKNWSQGDLYTKNGWTHIRDSEPNYWYINKSIMQKEYRFKYRKHKLKELFPDNYSDDKSETIIMNEAGYIRYWDCGNMVFEIDLK